MRMKTPYLFPLIALVLLLASTAQVQQILQVTNTTTGNNQGPKISPDGSRIIWGKQDQSTYQHFVWTADTQTLTPVQLTFSPQQSSSLPIQWAISGDGKTVVFVSGYELWKIPSTGGTATQLTSFNGPPGIVNCAYPISLSHDGSLACFTYFHYVSPTRTYDVYVVDTVTKNITNITKATTGSNDLAIGWISGDGKTVAFTQKRGAANWDVWLADSDGTNIRNLTGMGNLRTFMPNLDHHAQLCAFSSAATGTNYNVYTIRTDGSMLTSVTTTTTGYNYVPQMSADGERLSWKWSNTTSTQGELYMAYPEGTGHRQISQHGDIGPLYGNAGHALNGDGTMAVFNSKFNYKGGNPDGNAEVYFWTDALTRTGIPQTGATVSYHMNAPGHGGETYLMACSFFRTPGLPIPGAGIVPLTPDGLFYASISVPSIFQNFVGTLDANGKGTGKVAIPAIPGLSGIPFHTSFVSVDSMNTFTIYNPVKVTIQ